MNGYIYPKRDADGRSAIQAALDAAAKIGRGTVVLEGEWTVDGTLYIGDGTTLLFEGARLTEIDTGVPILTNSNRTRPRGKTLFGLQRGICLTGNGSISGLVDFVGVVDFALSGLSFEGENSGIILSYASGGRLSSLSFSGAKRAILCGAGARNCYITDIRVSGDGESVVLCSDLIPGRVVNYFGPDVKNNIVRGLVSDTAAKCSGEYCYDNIIEDDPV